MSDFDGSKRKLTNKEWVDFLSEQFDVSRTSAKDMLHAMMSVKRNDTFKKQLNSMEKYDPVLANADTLNADTDTPVYEGKATPRRRR